VTNTAVIAEGTVNAGEVTVDRYLKGSGPGRLHLVRFDESAIPPNGGALLFLQPAQAPSTPANSGALAPVPVPADYGNMCLPAYALSNGQAQALTSNAGSQAQAVLEQRISVMAAGKADPGPTAPGEVAAP
jgi:hypothetical protein